MTRRNGGIIGVDNIPTVTTASGMWSLQSAFQAIEDGNWPGLTVPIEYLLS